MIEINFERLRTLGLTPALANQAASEAASADDLPALELLRLTEVHRDAVRLHDGADELTARVLPRLTRTLADEGAMLAVGDWVLAATDAHGQIWVHARVPPLTHINRRDADGRRHTVVSNVDTALLVMGLDDDFNPRRLERYLALVHAGGGEAGITPAVVLTKADVIANVPGRLAERIEALRGRVPASIDLFAIDGTDPY
ncbi:MAG: GTPase RsgA, partial [Burkholderiales bacterium]